MPHESQPPSQDGAVVAHLWHERRLLEMLLYRLMTAQLLAAIDETRLAASALEDARQVVADLHRAVAARDSVLSNSGGSTTLPALAAAADEPMRSILLEHHDAFTRLVDEIATTVAASGGLPCARFDTVRAAAGTLQGDPGDRRRQDAFDASAVREMQEIAYEVALGALAREPQRPLTDFLRG